MIDVGIQLLDRGGRPLRFAVQQPEEWAPYKDAASPYATTFTTTDTIRFRHRANQGDPAVALANLLAPHFQVWVQRRFDPSTAEHCLALRAAVGGNVYTATFRLVAGFAAGPDLCRYAADDLLRQLGQLIVDNEASFETPS